MLIFYQTFCFPGFKKHCKTYHRMGNFVAASFMTEYTTVFFLLVNASVMFGRAFRDLARPPEWAVILPRLQLTELPALAALLIQWP